MQFVDPGGTGYFWETTGWETVTDHPSDVLVYSLRGAMSPEEMAGQPTYWLLPAVQAGQVHPWGAPRHGLPGADRLHGGAGAVAV